MNAKKKGNKGENDFAKWLRNVGLTKATRNSSSGGNIIKSDVVNDLDINFEVKTVKRLNLNQAMAQSERDANMSHTIPYVVVHFDGMPQDTWYMVMNNHDWLDLMNKAKEPKKIDTPTREMEYALKTLIQAAKKILKLLTK